MVRKLLVFSSEKLSDACMFMDCNACIFMGCIACMSMDTKNIAFSCYERGYIA